MGVPVRVRFGAPYIMNPFQFQLDTSIPCSGNVAFIGGTAGLSVERRNEIREEYKMHIGQVRSNYVLIDDVSDDIGWLNIYHILNKIWEEDIDQFLESHEFVGYFNDNEGFPIFKKAS